MNQKKELYKVYEQKNGEKKKLLFSSLDHDAALTVLELKAAVIAAETDAVDMKVISEDKGVKIWAELDSALNALDEYKKTNLIKKGAKNMKYQIIVTDNGGNLIHEKFSRVKWDNRDDAISELKDWFREDAQQQEGILDKNDIKILCKDGKAYSEAEIAEMEEFDGGEYVFPEDFGHYATGDYSCEVVEIANEE